MLSFSDKIYTLLWKKYGFSAAVHNLAPRTWLSKAPLVYKNGHIYLD